jgi:hypothetical protein
MIYVASSWRNANQQRVVAELRAAGHDVYDFQDPAQGNYAAFHWSEIDSGWKQWEPEQFIAGLGHSVAKQGFALDFDAMRRSDVCVLVLPCGRSAHLEAGWFAGRHKELHVLVPADYGEPELMYLLAGDPKTHMHTSMESLLIALAADRRDGLS